MSLQTFVSEFLTFLEMREERLLSWGFYNVSWTVADIDTAFSVEASEALQRLWDPFASQGRTLGSVLQQMRQRNLVYVVPDKAPDAYRTRFAEGVRLLANLRQMFKDADWATGPRLVSDIKVNITPRLYPRRDQSPSAVWDQLLPHCPAGSADLMRECFFKLSSRNGSLLSFAGFQTRAFQHVLKSYGSSGFTGSVVCAGTGSGKTKAFYVPAFLRIASELDKPPFTKVIAIYPRNVLLADQLREAITEADKLGSILTPLGRRPIRFGALLGDTPYKYWFEASVPKSYHWKRRGNASIIPYLKSPVDGGRSDLLWRDEDRLAGHTCLYREGATQPDVPSGVLALTREEMAESPPDILFLSLEMLNREMCNPRWEETFGMRRGPERSPRLLLLDEVHAYEGLAGAQAAWVLRRWRHWAQLKSIHVVGLSATLRDAPQHLASVAGLQPAQVSEFRPTPGVGGGGEMEAEGAEYNLAIKGDPAAGASLLGSSIQTGMLLVRLLTPRTQGPSGPNVEIRPEEFYRKKVFGFSDNLDSVNRWFSDITDAESSSWRHPLLASLRQVPAGTTNAIRLRRVQEGQVWELPRLIGHNLDQALKVTRCSSQDPGADADADLIIATSSLEVGFDDPFVGAILHHKRPGSMSSFIQRKGRAGRTRGSRPWTVVVLSDYGSDRWAFHSAEHLFQPEVDSLVLPTLNPFVLRVQLAQFLLDWIGRRLGGTYSAYHYLQGPVRSQAELKLQSRTRELLRGLLDQGQSLKEFERDIFQFFRTAGSLANEEARDLLNNLLWHNPRPLLMEVIPSLSRKLEANWGLAYPEGTNSREDAGAKRPLPQYISKATFAELEVGEAVIELEAFRQYQREPETVPIARLLSEACPGRVSKRFATFAGEPGYWHPLSAGLAAGQNYSSVDDIFSRTTFLEAVNGVSVFQPDAAIVVHRPIDYNDTSNGSWTWQTLARLQGEGEHLPIRETNPWRKVFHKAAAYLHSNSEWMELLRYAQESQFEVRRQKESVSGRLKLRKELNGTEESQAVGFRLRVDGVCFVLSPEHLNACSPVSSAAVARFRSDYFKHRVLLSKELNPLINGFQATWMADMSLAMLSATALLQKCDLKQAQEALEGKRPESAVRVLDVIFQMRGVSAAGVEEESRLRTTLLDFWSVDAVRREMSQLEKLLWEAPDNEFQTWVRKNYAATVAQSLCAAMVSMAPQVSEDDLIVDVLHRNDGGFDLMISEVSPGGLGQIETIVREVQRQPRRFLDGLEFALENCPREQMAVDLTAVAKVAACDRHSGIPSVFEEIRTVSGFNELHMAKESLKHHLQLRGFTAHRRLIISIVNKLLRPGTSSASDRLVFRLNRLWNRYILKLGIAVPMRTFAYTCTRHPIIGRFLTNYFQDIGGEPPSAPQLFAQIQQLLLEGCKDSCPECLNQRGRFYDLGTPSRALAREWLGVAISSVSLVEYPQDWQDKARQVLRSDGRVRLLSTISEKETIASAIPRLCVEEIDLESLRVPVSVGKIEQAGDELSIVLHIQDFISG